MSSFGTKFVNLGNMLRGVIASYRATDFLISPKSSVQTRQRPKGLASAGGQTCGCCRGILTDAAAEEIYYLAYRRERRRCTPNAPLSHDVFEMHPLVRIVLLWPTGVYRGLSGYNPGLSSRVQPTVFAVCANALRLYTTHRYII